MSQRKRFFIFFASAVLMFLFLYFSLSVREDQPLKKWGQWLPGNKVKSLILDRYTATGQVIAKNILFSDAAKLNVKKAALTELEVKHALRDADVEFSHPKTQARKKPKTYYLEVEILEKMYGTVIEVDDLQSYVLEFAPIQP